MFFSKDFGCLVKRVETVANFVYNCRKYIKTCLYRRYFIINIMERRVVAMHFKFSNSKIKSVTFGGEKHNNINFFSSSSHIMRVLQVFLLYLTLINLHLWQFRLRQQSPAMLEEVCFHLVSPCFYHQSCLAGNLL